MPAAERWPHGTRSRYISGRCRCGACRKANTAYERDRNRRSLEVAAGIALAPAPDGGRPFCPGDGSGPCREKARLTARSKGGACSTCRAGLLGKLVPAAATRAHLLALSRAGVGRRSVSAACDVAETVLQEVRAGRKAWVRRSTERRVLAVDAGARGDASLVPAGKTWRRIRKLVEKEGFTLGQIALRLGRRTPRIQFQRTSVTAKTALAVERLYRDAMGEA